VDTQAEPSPDKSETPFTEEVRDLLLQAQQGKPEVLPALQALLDEHPELWRQMGDLSWQAEQGLVGLASGPSLLARESIGRRLAELKAELAGPSPSPLEKLLVERIALCWLAVHLAELDWAACRQQGQAAGPAGGAAAAGPRPASPPGRHPAAGRRAEAGPAGGVAPGPAPGAGRGEGGRGGLTALPPGGTAGVRHRGRGLNPPACYGFSSSRADVSVDAMAVVSKARQGPPRANENVRRRGQGCARVRGG
jgi:hypothetical protein